MEFSKRRLRKFLRRVFHNIHLNSFNIIGQKILATLRLRVRLVRYRVQLHYGNVSGILLLMAVTILCRKLGQDSSNITVPVKQPRNRQLEAEN